MGWFWINSAPIPTSPPPHPHPPILGNLSPRTSLLNHSKLRTRKMFRICLNFLFKTSSSSVLKVSEQTWPVFRNARFSVYGFLWVKITNTKARPCSTLTLPNTAHPHPHPQRCRCGGEVCSLKQVSFYVLYPRSIPFRQDINWPTPRRIH